jgi:hypothetical protein
VKLRVGQALKSSVDDSAVVVVRAPVDEVALTCGGAPMVDPKSQPAPSGLTADQAQQGGTQVGKRYADDDLNLELLCTKAGSGTLAANGAALPVKAAKMLPSSD